MNDLTRRAFLKSSGAAGGSLPVGRERKEVMADVKSRVVLGKTNDRKEGVKAAIRALGHNPVKGKVVLIKPNFDQEQIARAVELGLGASSPEAIELIAADKESRAFRDQIRQVLEQG